MTRDNDGVGGAGSHSTQDACVAPRPQGEEEHHQSPGGPLATPDTAEGREAAEAEGEEA